MDIYYVPTKELKKKRSNQNLALQVIVSILEAGDLLVLFPEVFLDVLLENIRK